MIIERYPDTISSHNVVSLKSTWVYVFAPLLGGFLAGMFQRHANGRFIEILRDSAKDADALHIRATGMQNKGKFNRNRDFR